ncbi:MAG: metallophosphoesterase family protein, partial [bacterium]
FNAGLHRLTGKKPIIIPGNHDVRLLGNIGAFYQHISAEWQKVVVDDDIGVKFACFNSSESEAFAKGRVSPAQLHDVGGVLQNEIAVKPEVEGYLTVALVHHHPFPYEAPPHPTFAQRMLALFGGSPETFLRMEDADLFLDWCARWRVSAVLHGHKHIARQLTKQIEPEGAPFFDVTAIGCGSSLGAGGKPMSFVVLNWDERSRRWTTSFFESRNGGPFLRQAITSAVVPERRV